MAPKASQEWRQEIPEMGQHLCSLTHLAPPYPTSHQYKKKTTCFYLYKVLSVQTVSAVSFLEMAQRDEVCKGGHGWGCSSAASYVWLLWCEGHDPSSALHPFKRLFNRDTQESFGKYEDTIDLCYDPCQFGILDSSKYYNIHEIQLPYAMKKPDGDANQSCKKNVLKLRSWLVPNSWKLNLIHYIDI